jgi:glyoxylase-like metal-dependent hydrolase (beta-lactamase superfamily II)
MNVAVELVRRSAENIFDLTLRGELNMQLRRYFVEGLAHASYLVGADGEAAVVDPKRDVYDYLAGAERLGLKITVVLNTHPHADFGSGYRSSIAASLLLARGIAGGPF